MLVRPANREFTMPPSRSIAGPIAAVLALVVTTSIASAQQTPGVAQEVLASGRADQAAAVGGPADVYIGSIQLVPGVSYAGWHSHPGPVWVVVSVGELAVYGP